jgi:hypothetical protein
MNTPAPTAPTAFTVDDFHAINQCIEHAIKTGGRQAAKLLMPVGEKVDAAIAAFNAKKPTTENVGEPKQP